ncbi:MAG: hypothetical protein JG781_1232, partial [Peptococcaceae bacterium]|nr:hypothetical protein [Peptococcaceae bacterium]
VSGLFNGTLHGYRRLDTAEILSVPMYRVYSMEQHGASREVIVRLATFSPHVSGLFNGTSGPWASMIALYDPFSPHVSGLFNGTLSAIKINWNL